MAGTMLPRVPPPRRESLPATLALGASLTCLLLVWHLRPAYASENTAPAADARAAYSQATAENYDYAFGANKPFLPSKATTDTGQFIDPKSFPTAEYCGHCHQEAYRQWRQTAHANSFRTPWYVKNVNMLRDQDSLAYTRHCEGCHNPIALVGGALTPKSPVDRHFDDDGITCSVCHSIQKVNTYGTGSYVLAQPAVLVDPSGQPVYGQVSDKEILAHLDWHERAVMKDFYRTSEFCAACHKADLPRELNHYKWQRAFFVYDEWQQASFSRQSPLPFYVKDKVSTCQTCHMPLEDIQTRDYGSEPGKLMSHRWLGANTVIAKYYKYDEQLQKTMDFLRNRAVNVDLFALHRNGELIAPLGSKPFRIDPGDLLTVDVVIQNSGIGHSLVPEQRDFYQCWVEFQAKDASGHLLMDSGAIRPDRTLDPTAHSFTNRLVNVNGTLNSRHQVWDTRILAYNNTIASGRSQVVRYQFRVPRNATGAITITAKVNYRRFNQHFIDFGLDLKPGKHFDMPVTEMASRTRTLVIGDNQVTQPEAADNPEWMRWNNYGIGLLDAQQYEASDKAFAQVAQLRPTYADAFTNMAVVETAWQRYDDASTHLKHALELAPHNARALYYQALVERIQGNLDGAVADLREVAAQFPQSRDAHRELGYSLFQQHKYQDAYKEYRAVQSIDPDDLSAHYMLSIVCRRLGMKRDAALEATAFADQKADPTANVYALEYLQKDPDVANETVVWHVHRETAPAANGGGAAH
jgi:tetratricopeptide (TPR) repeat protein